LGKEPVCQNKTANFSSTSLTKQSGPPSEVIPNSLVKPKQTFPFDFQLKVVKFFDIMGSTLSHSITQGMLKLQID